jgi:hypothetical protein
MNQALADLQLAIQSLKPSGNTDVDYLKAMRAIQQAQHSLMVAELKNGSNTDVMSATKKVMSMMAQPAFMTFNALSEKFLSGG